MKFSATVTLQYDTPFSSFSHEEYQHGLEWIRDNGLEGAEVCISNYNNLDVYQLKDQLDHLGLGCSTISTGQARGLEGLSFISDNPEIIKKTQDRFFKHIDAAKVLGSKVTIGLIRGISSDCKRQKDLARLSESLKPVIDYAEKEGVTLVLEAINRYETAILNSAESTYNFIVNDLGNPDAVGILLDLFHSNIEDADTVSVIREMPEKIKHVHIADSNRWFPGYGHTDFVHIFRTLGLVGYNEYCSFECLNKPDTGTVLRETRSWVSTMRQEAENGKSQSC